jgi:hypothetical protein
MNRLSITSALMMVGLSGCTAGNGPFYVVAVYPIIPATCSAAPPTTMGGGITRFAVMDVRAEPHLWVSAQLGGPTQFFDTVNQPPMTLFGGRQIAPPGRDRANVRNVVLRYSSRPPIPGLTATVTDTIPIAANLSADNLGQVSLPVPLFGPNARNKLRDLVESNEDTFDFTSTLEIQGVLDQSGAEWRTAPFSMPMTLVKSAFNCRDPNVDQRVRTFPGGQFCNSLGVNQRVDANSCCDEPTGMPIPGVAGCDRLR